MKRLTMTIMVLCAFTLSACETFQNRGTKETVGTGAGAVVGGLLGSKIGDGSGQLWATGAGALLGAYLGNEIGRSLDRADRQHMNRAVTRAQSAPIGEPISWNNPESGNYGEIVAVKDGYTPRGSYCREFQQTVYIGGSEESAYGTACQQPDGSWQIVNK
ncbi:MAG: glycine zipper 2TM domain-containing protein [Alphaproteobacteria bacterium]|nr:glycine zipper 2TM domain-containing protein [Alphaproteobacteria bacterium]